MAKEFKARVSKRKRKTIDLSAKLDRDLLKIMDQKLLEGARLEEFALKDIQVKEQVRTKFNDASIGELAENIRQNGLIQPLVLHRKKNIYTLICGERRFRAMSLIDTMKTCPCFILENKSSEELMAIQFSENSSREALHYIDKADGILNYRQATGASERKIVKALGISKSEVHRSLLIARLPEKLKRAAKEFNIEKYVLIEFEALEKGSFKEKMKQMILKGEMIKRSQFLRQMRAETQMSVGKGTKGPRKRRASALPRGLSANAFLRVMNSKAKKMDLDGEKLEFLKQIVAETSDVIVEE